MNDKGINIVTIEVDTGRTIVKRIEEMDEDVNQLALHLEALVEAGFIESFDIKGLALPPLATDSSLFTEILTRFKPTDARHGIAQYRRAWDEGWRNRDAYFTRNALRNVR